MWILRIVFVFRQVCNCIPKQLLDNRVCVCVLLKGCRSVGRSVTTRLKGSVSWQSESVSIGHSSGSSGGQETV